MKLKSKFIPFGSLPYERLEFATKAIAKLFEQIPYIPVLPKLDDKDCVMRRTLENFPGVTLSEDERISFRCAGEKYEEACKRLDLAFSKPTKKNLSEFGFKAPFLEKYLQIIKKFKSANACINLLGPFTISQLLMDNKQEQLITNNNIRKIIIQTICVKAFWLMDKISEYSTKTVPLVILEEPMLCKLSDIKRENESVTVDLITNMIAKITEKIRRAGGIVCIHSSEKCDWQIPINAGVDMISFDAYNNPNNINIIPETITGFIERGGQINWAIVPATSENLVKSLNIEYLKKRLWATFDGLILAGVKAKPVLESAIVSIQGDPGKLPLIFAEKSLILSTQLAKKIPVKT